MSGTKKHDASGRFAVVIPIFNHWATIADIVKKTKALGLPVIVVDDGSTDRTPEVLSKIKGVKVISHKQNLGKGEAILSGLREAVKRADFAVTIDSDGQHEPADALSLIKAIPSGSRPIVVGCRRGMEEEKAPWTSRFGRGFSNFWVRCAGGPKLSDTQSGFRIYPIPECLELKIRSRRYQFEVEILARAGWKGMAVIEAPVNVSYSPVTGRISHFKPFVDFCRNSVVFSRMIFLRIVVPSPIRKRWLA